MAVISYKCSNYDGELPVDTAKICILGSVIFVIVFLPGGWML